MNAKRSTSLLRLSLRPFLIATLLLAWASPARSANQLQFFFPKDNDLTNTIDDQIVVKSIYWDAFFQPVQWLLLKPGNIRVLPAVTNTHNIQDDDVLFAAERALSEWNNNDLSNFEFEDDVFFSTSPVVSDPPPFDADFDGHNVFAFQSQLVTTENGVIAITSIFFMEHDIDASDLLGIPIDEIEPGEVIPVDLNDDGLIDISIPARNYKQGEIIETDIVFNSSLTFDLWPVDRDDVDPTRVNEVLGSIDIQAVMTHELGHAHGLAHTWIQDATMNPFLETADSGADFPTDPYNMRVLALDDQIAEAILYADSGTSTGAISGHVLDGQFIGLLPEGADLDNLPPDIADLLSVVSAPVFVGVPINPHDPTAPQPGLHPDNIGSKEGEIRLIAQVLTGKKLIYPAGEGGNTDLEPADAVDPNIDFSIDCGEDKGNGQLDPGEDINGNGQLDDGEDRGNGVLDPGEDANGNGVLDPCDRKVDSFYRIPGLPPRDDYAVYIDQDVIGDGPIAISNVNIFLSSLESFTPEFYGGTAASNPLRDDALNDDPLEPEFVTVTAGSTTPHIDIITDVEATATATATPPGGGTPTPIPGTVPDGSAAPAVTFKKQDIAFTPSSYVGIAGDMGDLNGDGFPDLVVAVFSGSQDVGGGLFNRIYMNLPLNPLIANSPRFFKDITFGVDGIPGTLDDVLPANRENSRDAKLGDFNGDGRLDLFITNAANGVAGQTFGTGGFDRLYLNEVDPDPTNPYGFRFRDVSAQWLPGLLNNGWGENFPNGWADSSRAAVGDIDGDGDLDIIVSLLTPVADSALTPAMIDTQPSANNAQGDHLYTPIASGGLQADQISSQSFLNIGYLNSALGSPLLNTGGPLVFSERVLINKLHDKTAPGQRFVDETLGADNVFGDSTDVGGFFNGTLSFASPNIDRMPPVFPPTHSLGVTPSGFGPTNQTDSPMGYVAYEPRLGPIFHDSGLDLLSVRGFRDPSTAGEENLAQSAYFQNIDTDEDGVADGYFACINFGMDFLRIGDFGRLGSALYPLRQGGVADTQPLLIGLPDGTPGDFGSGEADWFTTVNRGAFTGVIGDWEYRGAPKPVIASDTDFGRPYTYFPTIALDPALQLEIGAQRGQTGLVEGLGTMFLRQLPAQLDLTIPALPGGAHILTARDFTTPASGESHGSTVADFDHDGDFDVALANTVILGFVQVHNIEIVVNTPSQNNIYTNDGFAHFTDITSNAFPVENAVSFDVLSQDIDNDGDTDLIYIHSLNTHTLLLNQIYTPGQAPDPKSDEDSTMFYDQTPQFIPPIYNGSLNPPFVGGAFTGITTSVGSADFNADGLPDIVTAEGGIFSQGDFPQFDFNNGPARQEAARGFNQGLQFLKPIGAAFPEPRIIPPSSNFPPFDPSWIFNGYLRSHKGAYYGVSTGDFSGDGYPDLFFSRDGEGPTAYLNLDSSALAIIFPYPETTLNSVPDADTKPDGLFVNLDDLTPPLPLLLPVITDPCPDPSGSVVLKRLGRRLAAADFDHNGTLDVCIANGVEGSGAPNLLLFNNPITVFPFPVPFPKFTDVTETNLPTIFGDCGAPVGISDDTYAIGAADFDHDGDIDLIFANQTNFAVSSLFPPFRYLQNDGTGHFIDTNQVLGNIPLFPDTRPRYVLIGDFDGVGEWTEDLNHNGVLDPGEDFNNNGVLDRSEDVNGNGILDPGEDLNGNGVLDFVDLPDETVVGDINGDGIITKRTNGVWEPSWDIFITFQFHANALLINDPTNLRPGIFSDESAIRLPPPLLLASGGARAGDLDLDGDLDIVVAQQTLNSFSRPVQFLRNDGKGFFTDRSKEFPFPTSVRGVDETSPSDISFTGNAADVELVDIDLDGDLDVYVGMAGRSESFLVIGAENVMYINRTIGGNFNTGQLKLAALQPTPSAAQAPVVFSASPGKAYQGTKNLIVEVDGARFDATTTLDFGSGITVNRVIYISPTRLRLDLTIQPSAEVGSRSLGVQSTTTGLSSASTGLFNVLDMTTNKVQDSNWAPYE